ncbi:MAG: hypothetical protein AAFN77_23105 [Planctomycetota bacterium]
MSSSPSTQQQDALPVIQIDSPCHADWDSMTGDEAKRFCGSCQKHVHLLSEMTQREVSELISCGDRVCIRMERRKDGSIVTKDDLVLTTANQQGLTRRDWLGWLKRTAAAVLALIPFVALSGCRDDVDPMEPLMGEVCPDGPSSMADPNRAVEQGRMLMGDVAIGEESDKSDGVSMMQGGFGGAFRDKK